MQLPPGGGVHVVVVDGQLIVGTGKDIDDGRGNSWKTRTRRFVGYYRGWIV